MEITSPQESSKRCFTSQHQFGTFHARGEKESKVQPPSHSSFWGKNPKPSHQVLHRGQTLSCQRFNKLTKHSIFCSWQSPWLGVTKGITQQAQDKECWSCAGISALFTQMKIIKLPRAAIFLFFRGLFLMTIVKLRTEMNGWPHNSCQRINKAAWLGEVFM